MSTNFLNRLSFKLTRLTVLVAFLLGVAISCLQVYSDFGNQAHQIDVKIEEIFAITQDTAQRAVHQLDPDLAQEVVNGLSHFVFLSEVVLRDDRNHVMAFMSRPAQPSDTRWISEWIVPAKESFRLPLVNRYGEREGELLLKVDGDEAMSPFYQRAFYIFLSGVMRNLALGLLLAAIFQSMLTHPLTQIVSYLRQIDPHNPAGQRLPKLSRHKQDEVGAIIDATNNMLEQLEHNRASLQEGKDQLRALLDVNPAMVYAVNRDLVLLFVNKATCKFYGQKEEDILGQTLFDIQGTINVSEAARLRREMSPALFDREEPHEVERVLTDAMARVRHLKVVSVPIQYQGELCLLMVANDVTEKLNAERQLEQMAYRDSLTGLPNRALFLDRLKVALRSAIQSKRHGALFYIDLDDFRLINDSKGHGTGDQVLAAVSDRLQKYVSAADTLARIGGDEFCLICTELDSQYEHAESHVMALAENLLSLLRTPIALDNQEYQLTASIGMVIYPNTTTMPEELLKFVDTAVFQAKKDGRDRAQLFYPHLSQAVNSQVKLEKELKMALENDEFEFHLQPIVRVEDSQVVGAEALVRWQHPERGLVPPMEFIGFLEASGMITEVGNRVLRKLCAFVQEHRLEATLPEGFRFAINASAVEFHDANYTDRFVQTVESYQLPLSLFEIEITESAAIRNLEDSIEKMRALLDFGLQFSLDDFGTGYSSLSYLKRLPVSKIKIDRSFIQDLIVDPHDQALVSAIIAIGKNLNLTLVAEGVEWEQQQTWLMDYAPLLYQGYYFSRPVAKEAFLDQFLPGLERRRLLEDQALLVAKSHKV